MNTTTVSDLIAYLERLPQDAEVKVQIQPNYPLVAPLTAANVDDEGVVLLMTGPANEYGDTELAEAAETLI